MIQRPARHRTFRLTPNLLDLEPFVTHVSETCTYLSMLLHPSAGPFKTYLHPKDHPPTLINLSFH